MSVLQVVAGVVLIVMGLDEVFHTVLHPTGRGRLSHLAASSTWGLTSRFGRRGRTVAGPLAAVAVVTVWAVLQIAGWALVYLPFVPDGFAYNEGIDPESYPAIVEALYFSTVNMSTLGLGDVYPVDPWLRVFAPLQGLIGFALLTAAVAWFLQLYPDLGRRRTLALRIALIQRADTAGHLLNMESATSSGLLDSLTADLAQSRVDVWQNSESYYFTEAEPTASLAAQLPYALHLAKLARRSSDRTVRNSGQMLEEAIDDFADVLRDRFMRSASDTDAVLREYARQHRQRPTVPEEPAGSPRD
ncbi:potassium channel family protein [Agromyces bracchium]|uniref:Two pore domain potassium channel family protein n=1 Tax=Agromyces bracchium TaxID=88376 RepID=A0A6I3M6R3_9MICO|nr:potassium channel family protein [Agromyces bracchium]MTH67016.1 two pore domain potassium channel family protein [Agromyces bracchium]